MFVATLCQYYCHYVKNTILYCKSSCACFVINCIEIAPFIFYSVFVYFNAFVGKEAPFSVNIAKSWTYVATQNLDE